jgi:hypothetical protein
MAKTHPPKMPKEPRETFRLVITSLEELATFIALIRNDDLDALPALTAKLRASTTNLADAETTIPE